MKDTSHTPGEYQRFVTTTRIHVGELQTELAEGLVIEFDGEYARDGHQMLRVPSLRHAIKVGWLVPEGPPEPPEEHSPQAVTAAWLDPAYSGESEPPKEHNPQAVKVAGALRNKPELLIEVLDILGFILTCEVPGCDRTDLVLTPSMTAYEWDGKGDDPNRDLWLCKDHSEEHTEQMQDQWDEYHAGLV